MMLRRDFLNGAGSILGTPAAARRNDDAAAPAKLRGHVWLQTDYFPLGTMGEVAIAYPPGAALVRITLMSGAGSGASCPNATTLSGGSGGGAGGRSERMVTPLPARIVYKVGHGGAVPEPGYVNGNPGEDSYVKDGAGTILCRATGALGGVSIGDLGPAGFTNMAHEGGSGGNHENAIGDYGVAGESGGPCILFGNIRIAGHGATSPDGAGGGKGTTSQGHGHGPGGPGAGGGGALAYGGGGPYSGAGGADGYARFEWYRDG